MGGSGRERGYSHQILRRFASFRAAHGDDDIQRAPAGHGRMACPVPLRRTEGRGHVEAARPRVHHEQEDGNHLEEQCRRWTDEKTIVVEVDGS